MTVPTRPQGRFVWLIGLAAIVGILSLIAWTSMSLVSRELSSARESHGEVLRAREVLTDLQTVLLLLRDAETSERGYVITGDAAFLDAFETARDSLDEHLLGVETVLTGVGDRKTLDQLLAASRHQIAYLSQVVELQRSGDKRQVVQIIHSQVGKQRMEAIRRLVLSLEQDQRHQLAQRAQAFNDRSIESEGMVKSALVAAVLLVLSASALLYFYAYRRMLAESVAAEASQMLRSTMDNITEGVVVYDQNMRVLTWNPRFLELRRLDINQIRSGMTASELMHAAEPLTVSIAGTTHQTRLSEPGFGDLSAPFQGEGTTPSGMVLKIWGSPIANGDYIVTISDVTALRNSEAAYRDRAARLNSTLDNVVDAIITINESGSIESWSKSAERLFGYATEEVLHRNVKYLMPDQHAFVLDGYLRNHMTTGEQRALGTRRQVEALHKDGRKIPVEVGLSEMFIGSRRLFVAIVRDISERLEIDRMKSGFVSTVSHELRTPLTSIGGSLGLLAGGAAGELSPKAAKLIDIAKQNSDRLVRLINDILDLEKAESGKLELRVEELALVPIVEQAIELNRGYADSFGVAIKLEPHEVDRAVVVDRDRFIQVLTNLLSNAVKYSPRGGTVRVSVTAKDSTATVSVLDEGTGIPPQFEKRIFQKFSQADSSDTRAKGGTGLGLSIARTLMERFNGSIDFERGRRRGANFCVTLPSRPPSVTTLSLPALSLPSPHILICEDDPDMTEYLSVMLNGAGMTVGTAETAGEAKAAMEGEHFDLLLIDMHLPDADGLEVVKELRNDQAQSMLPVIVMTGSSAVSNDEVQALKLADLLQKPVRPERLVGAIRSALLAHDRKRIRILHVEDDPLLTELVQTLLEGPADVVAEYSVSGARTRLEQETFDMVILDITLGDGSGLDLLPLLQQGANPPAVVLYTANEPSQEVAAKVAAVMVKSRHSVTDLLSSVRVVSDARARRNITAA
ncbi:MAG: response regulator [Steroidobacter sp.]